MVRRDPSVHYETCVLEWETRVENGKEKLCQCIKIATLLLHRNGNSAFCIDVEPCVLLLDCSLCLADGYYA